MMNHDLKDISDGKLYDVNDMVKVDCHDCAGCSDCCCGMGDSVILDPYDVYQMTQHMQENFESLLNGPVELHVEDGLILPNLKMDEQCHFLNQEGRCSIHAFRPGLCRLFPLGRNYDENGLKYFLLNQACPMTNRSKMKVSKWLGVGKIRDYQVFLVKWHDLTKRLRVLMMEHAQEEAYTKQINMLFLQFFYMTSYDCEDFYTEIAGRLDKFSSVIS